MDRNLTHCVRFFLLLICLAASLEIAGQTRPASQFRTVTITTEPNASVWIDGVLYGSTGESGTLEIRTVSAGAHSLRVRAPGFKEVTRPITAAQRGTVKVSLVKTSDEAELAFQEGERLSTIDRDRSADAYRKALKLKPNYPEAQLALARVLSDAGDLDEAKKAIAAARRLRPGYAEASAVEGRIHKEYGDIEKAIATFQRALTEGKGFQPEAYTGLGLLFKEKAEGAGGSGNFDEETEHYAQAQKYLRTALKQLAGAPDASIIYQLLGLIYERQKMYPEAIALYEEFLAIYPDSNDATAVRSFIVQLKKDRQNR